MKDYKNYIIQNYFYEYSIATYPFIRILKEADFTFFDYFGTFAIPCVYIYNRNGKLIKSFIGETKVETIIKYLYN